MNAGIIGASGYAGAELTRLLYRHPNVSKLILSSISYEGENIEDLYPNFLGRISGPLLKAEDVIASSDVVFSALPHAVGESYAAASMEKGIHFIDLSADFRFDDDEQTYTAWYGKKYQFPHLHKKSIYGLVELNRQKMKEAAAKGPVIIGNPGCYPTGASLGIMPALCNKVFRDNHQDECPCIYNNLSNIPIIINAVTGTTGGGREPSKSFHYSECADSVAPYKVASHRHSPEISRSLQAMAAKGNIPPPQVIFTPHLAPMNRGILSTIYIPLSEKWRVSKADKAAPSEVTGLPSKEIEEKTNEIRKLYDDFYKDEPFVRVMPKDVIASTGRVRHSNFCDISVHIDINGSTLIVVTAIDNMVKGAAGQAVQCMNVLFGFKETDGLETIPMLF